MHKAPLTNCINVPAAQKQQGAELKAQIAKQLGGLGYEF